MKKGFTMIELIFVIVILGILASVAIPRLAATREDAEISAAVANLRTLVSDATAYYTAKGSFDTNTKWSEITNVPLTNAASANANAEGNLKIGGVDGCIKVKMVDRADNKPAHILITKSDSANGVCKQVQDADPIKAYFDSKIDSNTNGVAIGSSTSIYPPAPAAKPTT
ncbi:MAG: type II secretion system protein [Campylobacteraceae bacterium]|nr:type II secretion system protein [Campylobacteraceae bacterium]